MQQTAGTQWDPGYCPCHCVITSRPPIVHVGISKLRTSSTNVLHLPFHHCHIPYTLSPVWSPPSIFHLYNIYMYACMYARTYVCMYACMYARTYVCMYACMFIFRICILYTVWHKIPVAHAQFLIGLVVLYSTHCLVPSAPLELLVEDVSSGGFTLEWNPPSTPNGIIDFYLLELFADNNLDLPALNPINVSSTSYTFTGLAPFTGYSVQVCAYTIGCSDSASLNVTTLGGEICEICRAT